MLSALYGACGFRHGTSPKLPAQPPPSEPEIGHSIGPTGTTHMSRGILALLVLAIAPSLAMSGVIAGPLPQLSLPQPHIVTGIQQNGIKVGNVAPPPPPPSTRVGAVSSYAGSRQNCVVTGSHHHKCN
jgi:hypothetical protein